MRVSLLRGVAVASVVLSLLVLTACGGGSGTGAAPASVDNLGLMELSVNSATGESSVKMLNNSGNSPAAALFNDDAPQGIDLQQIAHSTHDVGSPGNGGYRYISVTYQVRNARYCATPGTCTPYPNASDNLVFVAARVTGNLADSAVSSIKKQDGTTDATLQSLSTQMLPTAGMQFDALSNGMVVASGQDSLQVYSENEIAQAPADSGALGLLPYGYVVKNASDATTNSLPGNPANGQWDGRLTFAFKVPLQANPANDAFAVSFVFQVLNQHFTRVVQGVDEQSTAGNAAFAARVVALTNPSSPLSPIVLNGSTSGTGATFCDIRIAGAAPGTAFLTQGCDAGSAADMGSLEGRVVVWLNESDPDVAQLVRGSFGGSPCTDLNPSGCVTSLPLLGSIGTNILDAAHTTVQGVDPAQLSYDWKFYYPENRNGGVQYIDLQGRLLDTNTSTVTLLDSALPDLGSVQGENEWRVVLTVTNHAAIPVPEVTVFRFRFRYVGSGLTIALSNTCPSGTTSVGGTCLPN